MKKNIKIYFLIIISTIYVSFASDYHIDITSVRINGNSIENYNDIVIAETDTIIFNYKLNKNDINPNTPFLYKLTLKENQEVSERTAGLEEILYCNLIRGKYAFEVSAFDLAGNWMTEHQVITFEVNNKMAALLKKVDTLETQKKSFDSTRAALEKTINTDKICSELSEIIIYISAGITIVLIILFIIFLIRRKKNTKKITSQQIIIEEDAAKILALQTQLNKSCDVEEVEKLKSTIENISKRLEDISTLNIFFTNEVSNINNNVSKFSDLQTQKNYHFANIVKGITDPTEVIKGLVGLLRNYDFNASESNDIVSNIIDYTNKIIDNAEDIKRLAEFENNSTKLNFDTVYVSTIVDSAVNKNIIDANKKNITIKTNINTGVEKIYADQQKLIVVMHNLINNAVKFTSEDGKIDVNVYKKNDLIHFEVSDNGIGIDSNDLQKLYKNLTDEYDPDDTLNSDSTIGLLTIRKYVDAHNGKAMISSILNKGSTFSFTIPVNRS